MCTGMVRYLPIFSFNMRTGTVLCHHKIPKSHTNSKKSGSGRVRLRNTLNTVPGTYNAEMIYSP